MGRRRPTDAPAPDPQRPAAGGPPIEAGPGPLKAGARRMLHVLAQLQPLQVTRAQLATLARMKASGGTFGSYYSQLRRHELLTESGDGLLSLTAAGRVAIGAATPDTALSPAAIQEQWRAVLKAGARIMLDALIAARPEPLTRAELAAAAGLEPSGTYLSTLRRNGLADVDGDTVRAAEVLFFRA